MITYLLDTNIIIKIWNENPRLLEIIEQSPDLDYKIDNETAVELSRKEVYDISNMPIRFIKVLNHMVNNDCSCTLPGWKENRFVIEENGALKVLTGNKISSTDYGLIMLCQRNTNYILVSEDKKLVKSAIMILGNERVLDYKVFLESLKNNNI